ncbi:hypothetical protein DPSP01_014624, partial [Paraphaeosphaeria sporulosa]
GYAIKLFGGLIAWRASEQDTVTTSNTEAELLALSQVAITLDNNTGRRQKAPARRPTKNAAPTLPSPNPTVPGVRAATGQPAETSQPDRKPNPTARHSVGTVPATRGQRAPTPQGPREAPASQQAKNVHPDHGQKHQRQQRSHLVHSHLQRLGRQLSQHSFTTPIGHHHGKVGPPQITILGKLPHRATGTTEDIATHVSQRSALHRQPPRRNPVPRPKTRDTHSMHPQHWRDHSVSEPDRTGERKGLRTLGSAHQKNN